MSTIRRLVAVALIPLFIASFVVTLLAFRVNGTVLDPGFYTGVLHRVDVYDFFYDELLPLILARAGLDVTRAPSSLGLSATGLSTKMRRVIPPEMLEQEVKTALDAVLPYLTGRADSFELTLQPGPWVEHTADVIRDLAREPELYDYLLDVAVRKPLQSNWSSLESKLPFPLALTQDDVVEGAKTVCSSSWVSEQLDAVLASLVPYLTGKTEDFSVLIPLDARASAGVEVLRGWLHRVLEGGGYDFFVRKQGVPRLRALLTAYGRLPYGVTFNDEQLGTLVTLALPQEWVERQLDLDIDRMKAYLIGRASSGAFSIPLAERADAAAVVVAAAVNVKARAVYAGLRECSALEERALGTSTETLPGCRVPGLEYDDVRARAGYDTVAVVKRALARGLPASIDVTQDDLRSAFHSSEGGLTLEDVRQTLRDGYRFNVEELRRLVEAASPPDQRATAWERFQNVRLRIREGIHVTDVDLRRAADPPTRASLERIRRWLGYARALLVLLVAADVLLCGGIAMLGGRSRAARLIWTGSTLLLGGAAAVAVAVGVVALRGIASPAIEGFQAGRAITDKLLELWGALVSSFASPLGVQGLVVALTGLALVLWNVSRVRRAQAQKVREAFTQ